MGFFPEQIWADFLADIDPSKQGITLDQRKESAQLVKDIADGSNVVISGVLANTQASMKVINAYLEAYVGRITPEKQAFLNKDAFVVDAADTVLKKMEALTVLHPELDVEGLLKKTRPANVSEKFSLFAKLAAQEITAPVAKPDTPTTTPTTTEVQKLAI